MTLSIPARAPAGRTARSLRWFGLAALLVLGAAGDARADSALSENRPAPLFALADAAGKRRLLAEYHGRATVLLFACGCPSCHAFGMQWAKMQRSGVLPDAVGQTGGMESAGKPPPITLVVYMGDAAAARLYAAQAGLDMKQTALLPDPEERVTRLYHALPCPRLFVLDPAGVVRYVNHHADDAPQKASADAIVARTIDGLRRTTTPAPTKAAHPLHAPARTVRSASRSATSAAAALRAGEAGSKGRHPW